MSLPIEQILPDLLAAAHAGEDIILEAPPGAGKTTMVPLALLRSAVLAPGKIIVLEPRRIAARTAAHRMAWLLDERVGETVGYRMRLESVVGRQTRIEVVTEGVLARMLQDDPSLEGVSAVLFDEFHERSLDADLALALTLKGRELFRTDQPLRLIVMSATLDTAGVSTLLPAARLLRTEGRSFPVDVIYGQAANPRERIADRMVQAITRVCRENPQSSVLAFLPGQGEIRRVADALPAIEGADVFELYGNLTLEQQTRAIAPPVAGRRKVVLATNLAETSLTIEGVDVVVDSGLAREPVFDPGTAMTRLETRRISKAASVQRMGRAGRLRPGKCYRLWSQSQQDQLATHGTPEILAADLAPLAMQLFAWGIKEPSELDWIDTPPAGAWRQARELLRGLEAIDDAGGLTATGLAMASMPVHPRLAHMLIRSVAVGQADAACELAAFLSDRDPFPDDPDVMHRLDILRGNKACPTRQQGWRRRTLELAGQFRRRLDALRQVERMAVRLGPEEAVGFLLACAYPDRIARRRHSGGYQLANGRSANFASSHRLSKHRWLAVAEVGGARGKRGDMIRTAAPLETAMFDTLLAGLKQSAIICDWDKQSGRFIAEQRETIGELVLATSRLDSVPIEARTSMLVDYIRSAGLGVLPMNDDVRNWQARVQLARQRTDLPDVSDEALLADLATWLEPYLVSVERLDDLKRLDVARMLADRLSFEQARALDRLAPVAIEVPSGSRIKIDYSVSPPKLAVKLQEMFGCDDAPAVLEGTLPLQVHLLSPAGRPLQVTQDLAHFWRNGYGAVQKEMKGRYPKHPWPDDPTTAVPTRHTRHRGG